MSDAGGKEVGRISIRVMPKLNDFRQRVKSAVEEIERTITARIDVHANTTGFRQQVHAVTQGLRAQVHVDVDHASLQQMLLLIRNAMSSQTITPFGSGGGMRGMGGGMGGMGSMAAILAGITVVAAPLMGLLTTSLLALPGLIAAVAAPVGALMLGMDGLKKAAETLTQPFTALKEAMSAKVETQFAPVFERLGGIFPMLERALPRVTQGLADLAGSFVDTITSGPGMSKIEGIIGNIGTAISAAAPGIGSFTDGFLTLASELTAKLPAISEWFNGAGESFKTWIDKMSSSGTLSTAFDSLGTSLKTILDSLGRMATEGMKFMENPEKMANFNKVLSGIGDVLVNIVTWSNRLSAVWQGLAFLFTPISELGNVWTGIKVKAEQAWNGIKATVAEGVASVVSFVAGLPGKLVSAIGDLSGTLIAAGQSLMDGLLNGIKARVQAVYDFVSGIAGKIAALKGPLPYDRKVLIPNGQALMEGLGDGLRSGFSDVLTDVKGMAGQLSDEMQLSGSVTTADEWANKFVDVGVNFARATGDQAMSDLGIGGGAITGLGNALLDYGVQMAKKGVTNIYTTSMDDALAAKQRQDNRAAMQWRK